jgi:tetratricopeptide (TPR) repeat protein
MDDRAEIMALAPERIWGAEGRDEFDTRKGVPRFTIVDRLVERVRESRVFICVLRDRYGSSVFENAESVSFFETEIYQAALFHNNAHFFLMEPFTPDARLRGLIEIVNTIRPGIIAARTQTKTEVLDAIRRVLGDTRRARRPSLALSLRRLVGGLALQRGHPHADIEFFDRVFRPVSARPDRDHITSLLADLRGEAGIEKRLTRMWIALRELSAAPYDDPAFAEYLPLWHDALGAWASAAAWYGLHGHLYAGRLAAVNSALKILSLPGWPRRDAPSIHASRGGRASEYYSIAKLVPGRRERDLYFALALSDINDAIAGVDGDISGHLSIRGHIHRTQGRPQAALSDFREMRWLREQRGDAGGIGEALSDLGLIELSLGRMRDARTHLREGAEMLRTAGDYPFAIRAQKRLALAHLRSGRPLMALRELWDAYDRAKERQVYAQITPLMEFTHDLAVRLGIWPRSR